jgi:hypothetical protein
MVALELAVRAGEQSLADAVAELFSSRVVRPRYMVDHIDQVGRAAVMIARIAAPRDPSLSTKIAEGWASLMTPDDPDAVSVQEHLDAIAAEAGGAYAAAIELYERSLTGLPRRAATITADAHQGLARCWDACGDRPRARAWATSIA